MCLQDDFGLLVAPSLVYRKTGPGGGGGGGGGLEERERPGLARGFIAKHLTKNDV